MSDRLPWQRTDNPKSFVAILPEGRVELWFHTEGAQMERGWRVRLTVGETSEVIRTYGADKQAAADEATRLWPNIVREERVRVAKIEAKRKLEQQIEDAWQSGKLDIMAFGLGSSTYDRLLEINSIVQRRHWLKALKPLAAAVSEELYRRRVRPR